MPRKNRQIKHEPFRYTDNDKAKVRYVSKQAAEKAADLRMLQYPDLRLEVYQGLNGGWYLTSLNKKT